MGTDTFRALFERSVALAAKTCTHTAAHAASCLPLTMPQATAEGSDTRRRVTAEQCGPEHMRRPAPRLAHPDRLHAAACAHAGAPRPDDVSRRFASGRPVVELPAEELADLVRGLDRRSSAPDGKLLEVGLAASEDEADGVVEGGQLDGAEVAGHIVAWGDLRTALRDLRREHVPLARSRTVADLCEPIWDAKPPPSKSDF